ncbi:PGN_0703 family putative restriction endonuclease [Brachyspira intermedia]|uniref:PGN_0703 family putative restriction endonuclease n=1 Tax=Brachyspira intermedia TaxID=84377 RepID=UPI003004E219
MYKDLEKKKIEYLIKSRFFNGDAGNGIFRGKKYPYILEEYKNNFYPPILDEVLEYFEKNNIKWWNENVKKNVPTANTLSSQAACLNHLFFIRRSKFLSLYVLNFITNKNFIDVFPLENDEYNKAYISFEVSSYNDHLNEITTNRGELNTSIDAVFLAEDENNKKCMVVIEWKYTEKHSNEDASINIEDNGHKKGEERLNRYAPLIKNSKQLKHKYSDYKSSVYFYGELYQFTRQTLWAEQMIENKNDEIIKADDFLHLAVISNKNKSMLSSKYKISNMNLEDTWRNVLNDNSKFMIIDNKKIIEALETLLQLIEYDYIDYKKIIFDIEYPKPDSSLIDNILIHTEKSKTDIINELTNFLTYLKTRY